MEVAAIRPGERPIIDSYGDGGFRVSGERIEGSVLVLPDRTESWPVTTMDGLGPEILSPVTATDPPIEILLLGCGERMTLVPAALKAHLREIGIAVEPMDTGAACRTYNVLLSEHRRVAAALIAV
ncbi:MAG: Mth938-like domain-containing protein [Azospirillaceae bacterium]